MALVSLVTAQSLLGSNDVTDANQLTAVLSAVDRIVKEYVGQEIESGTYTEYYAGNNTPYLVLRQRPVISITSICEDSFGLYGFGTDAFPSSMNLTAGADYGLRLDGQNPATGTAWSKSGIVVRPYRVWSEITSFATPGNLTSETSPTFGNIKVVYVAGYPTVPMDIQLACIQIAKFVMRTLPLGQEVQSERIGAYSYDMGRGFLEMGIPEAGTTRSILGKYKEVW